MLSFRDASFSYDPYPIGVVRDILPVDCYEQLLARWPPTELFAFKPALGNKYSLSEVNNSGAYHDHVRSHAPWYEFYCYVKSKKFIQQILKMLSVNKIDLGLANNPVNTLHRFSNYWERFRGFLEKLKRLRDGQVPLSARFEFSMLPADKGCIKPHTDAPQKHITLVISMVRKGEWDAAHGGGTEVLRPRDITRNYNYLNKQLEFDEIEAIQTFPFNPNQCVVFFKTFNSLHAVSPMSGANSSAMRKTLTINIESKAK